MAVGKILPTVAIGGSYVYHNFLPEDQRLGGCYGDRSLTGWWGGNNTIKKESFR